MMPALTLTQFRQLKQAGFPGWETACRMGNEDRYVSPADARYGAPLFPFGVNPEQSAPAFERWCAETLTGDFFVTTRPWSRLVYCHLKQGRTAMQRAFATQGPRRAPDRLTKQCHSNKKGGNMSQSIPMVSSVGARQTRYRW